MSEKLLIFDVETTGTLYYRHCIHQLSGMIVIDGGITEYFNLHIRPHEKAIVDEEALKHSGVTKDIIEQYPHRTEQFKAFMSILARHINPYDPEDKFFLLGFNNSWFDNEFLRNYFVLEGDESFGCWFWQNTIDVMVLASYYLMPDRHRMPSFKLKRVALYLGIPVDESKLHDARYDLDLTYQVYLKVKGKTIDDWD
jgi:DNA polymerase III subunit epsilon